MRAASKSFLRALAKARKPRCKAAHTTDRCEREEGHRGKHLFTFPDGSTMQWTDKKSTHTKGKE